MLHQQRSWWIMVWRININIVIVIFIVISLLVSTVDGYASWLKCYVDLDHEEIVMHHPMTLPQDAPHEVFLEVQPYGETTWISREEFTLPKYDDDNNTTTTTIPPGESNDTQEMTTTRRTITTHTLKVRLRVPHALRMEEVQYVVQVKGNGASFLDLGVMCDGGRAFSRSYEEHVVLRINTTLPTNNNTNDNDDVELLAGWASEYGPVALTRIMRIKRNNVVDPNRRDEL
jgi:hypothetical protein